MKKVIGILLAGSLLLGVAGKVMANEGIFELGSVNDSGSSCYVMSVYEGGRYNISGTCRDLLVPYNAEQNRYVMWKVEEDGGVVRVGEVVYGKIDRATSGKFVELVLTAESSSSPRKPSESVVARGEWSAIPLVGENERVENLKSETKATQVTEKKDVVVDNATEETKQPGTFAKILATIGKVIGIGFLVLLVGVVVMTVITRRKEQE